MRLQRSISRGASLLSMLIVSIVQPDRLFFARADTFGDRLFTAALPFANKSLHGRFISEMVAGTLPREVFQQYLYQDNLYLTKYARAFAALAARADSTDEFSWLLNASYSYLHEHGKGANNALEEEVFERNARPVTVAYTSFFLQATWSEGPILAYASLIPCQRLYDWLFRTIKATRHIADDNPYKAFIDHYADPRYDVATKMLERYLEHYVVQGISQRLSERAQYHYNTAMNYEIEFFQQAFLTQEHSVQDPRGLFNAGTLLLTGARKPSACQVIREDRYFSSMLPTAIVILGVAIASSSATFFGAHLLLQKPLGATCRAVTQRLLIV